MSGEPTGLGHAVWGEDVEAVRALLAKGADANLYGGSVSITWTPLMEAVNEVHGFFTSAQEEIINLLLSHGADVNRADDGQRTALHHGVGITETAMRALIRAGADVNATALDGATPLHEAVRRGAVDTVEVLVEAGAQLRARDASGRTPADHLEPRDGLTIGERARLMRALGITG